MAGIYLNDREEYKKIIQNWINTAIKNSSWEKFQEIHIDEIGNGFKLEKDWLKGTLFILNIFNECLKENYKILLVIELNYNKNSIDIDKFNWEYLENHISSFTPPAFYLFPTDDFRLTGTLKELNLVENFVEHYDKSYFKEEYDGEEYLVTIYLLN